MKEKLNSFAFGVIGLKSPVNLLIKLRHSAGLTD